MMRVAVAILVASAAFTCARLARSSAKGYVPDSDARQPYAPSPGAAPYLSLGYGEAAADLFFVRLRGYVGSPAHSARAITELCEAIVALDPQFERIYEFCGFVMTLPAPDISNETYLRAIALLERGSREFPSHWRLPNLAGQIYTQDLKTYDPAQRRDWDEKGTLLVESAIRKPGAPADLALWAAVMRTRFGQHQRTVEGLREVLLLTNDAAARARLIKRLAELEEEDADAIAGELFVARRVFERSWHEQRPMLPANFYVLLGPRMAPGLDMATLATGGRDLISANPSDLLPAVE